MLRLLRLMFPYMLLICLTAIFMGMLNDQKQRTNGIGADLMLRPSNASYMNGVGGAPMPVKNIEALANPEALAYFAGRNELEG